jgi:hypothetical protein
LRDPSGCVHRRSFGIAGVRESSGKEALSLSNAQFPEYQHPPAARVGIH